MYIAIVFIQKIFIIIHTNCVHFSLPVILRFGCKVPYIKGYRILDMCIFVVYIYVDIYQNNVNNIFITLEVYHK